MKVLVTGGAGYIGSVVAAHLVEAGHSVVVVDNLSQGHRDAVPDGAQFIEADIAGLDGVLTREDGIEAVLHFAALMSVADSMQHPDEYWQNNTVSTLKLLDAMRNLGVQKFIFSSTAATYGEPLSVPITEEEPVKPTSTYGMTKLAIDMAITSYAHAYGLAATSLRYFNVAGAYGRYGERHPVESHIIPIALRAANQENPEFTIFGTDYPTPDGTCVRDYIHVADLARAHLLALDALKPGTHTIYNLGNGNGFSNLDITRAVEEVTGKKLAIIKVARRPGDPSALIASSKKAQKELGWTPQKPELKTIVADAWEFYQQREDSHDR